jgi:hypothetical protein
LVHVLTRLVIAASCTSSAAALDVRVDRSKSSAQLVGATDVKIISNSKQGHQTVRSSVPLVVRRPAR